MTNKQAKINKKRLRLAFFAVGGAVLLAVAVSAYLLAYFNDAYFKTQLQTWVKTELGRDLEARDLRVSFFGGRVVAEGVRLLNADKSFTDKDTLRVERLTVGVNVWPALISGGKRLEGLRIEVERPELIVERRGVWPKDVGNLDDIVEKLRAAPPGVWPKQTGLHSLSGVVTVRGGSVSYRDCDASVGVTRVENFELNVALNGLGQTTPIKAGFSLSTPEEKAGTVAAEGRILWLGADGVVAPEAFQDMGLLLRFDRFDIAQLARHWRAQAPLLGGRFTGALGDPFRGVVTLEASSLSDVKATGELETAALLSVCEGTKRVAGEFPARLELNFQGGFQAGAFAPGTGRFLVTFAPSGTRASGADAAHPLALSVETKAAAAGDGGASLNVALAAHLDELFAGEIGSLLGLKDRIGGKLTATVDAAKRDDGHVQAAGALKTEQGFVMVGDARQPTALNVNFTADVTPDARGVPENVEMNFTAVADSFSIRSLQPLTLQALNIPQKTAARAKLKVNVNGRAFWKQFGPLLEVANLSTPLEEELDAEVTASGGDGKVEAMLEGALKRQSAEPSPLRLTIGIAYDGAFFTDAPTKPYLLFDLKAGTDDKSLFIQLNGAATHGNRRRTFAIPTVTANGDLHAFTNLHERFGAYAGPLFFGARLTAAGALRQSGSAQFVQTLDAAGKILDSSLTLTSDATLANFEVKGAPLVENGPPLLWRESEASIKMGLVLSLRPTSSLLSIQPLKLKTAELDLEGELVEADLGRLRAAGTDPFRLWPAALPQARLNATVRSEAIKRLQSLGALPGIPALAGDFALKVAHDPQVRRLTVETCSLHGPLLRATVSPTQFDLGLTAEALAEKPFSAEKLTKALPSLALEIDLKAEAFTSIQTALGLPSEPLAAGAATLRANYDAGTKKAALRELAFNGPDVALTFSMPEMDVETLVAVAGNPQAQWVPALPSFTLAFTAKAAALERLRTLGVFNTVTAFAGGLNPVGTFALKTHYAAADDELTLEQLEFQRGPGATIPVVALSATGRISALRALLAKPPTSIAQWSAHLSQGLNVPNLTLDPDAVCGLLERQKTALDFIAEVRAGVYRFKGPINLRNLTFKSAAAGSFDVAFELSAPLAHHPRPGVGRPPAGDAAAALTGTLSLAPTAPLRLTFGQNETTATGTLNLDQAGLRGTIHPQYFVYAKPEGVPCKLAFAVAHRADGWRAMEARLVGGPVSLSLMNLFYNTTTVKPALTVEKFTANTAAAGGTLTGLRLDLNADDLRFQFDGDPLDLSKLTALGLRLPPNAKLGGTLGQIKAQYAGKLSAFPGGLQVHSSGTNISMDATEAGKSARLTLAADLSATPAALSAKTVSATLVFSSGRGNALSHEIQFPLEATARKAGEGVIDALLKPGLPLLVRISNARATAPLDVDALLEGLNTLANVWSPGPGDMSGIGEMRLELSATAPAVSLDETTLSDVKLTSAELDCLRLSVNAAAGVYGGTTTVRVTNFDLRTQAFAVNFAFSAADLRAALADPSAAKGNDDYQIFGRASGTGELTGVGFKRPQRRTWNGTIKTQIEGLIAQKGDGKASKPDPLKIGASILGRVLGGDDGVIGTAGRAMNIYSEDFGLFLNRLEFEPLSASLSVEKGVARFSRSSLTGKEKSAGLRLDFLGAIDLVTQRFADDLRLLLISLPPKTQTALRLNELDETERQTILKEFADGKFQPLVLRGKIGDPATNKIELGRAFYVLDQRIHNSIQAKKAREAQAAQAAQGAQPAEQPPPEKEKEKKKGGLWDLLGR